MSTTYIDTTICKIEPATEEEISNSMRGQNEFCEIVLQHAENIDDVIEETNCLSPYSKMDLAEPDLEEDEFSGDRWPLGAVSLLIQNRLKMEETFTNPKVRKVKLWDRISKFLCDEHYYYTAEECQAKFRHMLGTYRKIAERKYLSGSDVDSWRWYNEFDNVYRYKPSLEKPPDYLLGSTLEKNVERKYHKENLRTSVKKLKENEVYYEDYENDDNEEKIWTRSTTKILLETRAAFNQAFHTPGIQKNRIWEKIARQMRENGIEISAKECSVKFRNLIGTYRKNVARKEQSDETDIIWEWFDIVRQIDEYKPVGYNKHSRKSKYMNRTEEEYEASYEDDFDESSRIDNDFEYNHRKRPRTESNEQIYHNHEDTLDDPLDFNSEYNSKYVRTSSSTSAREAYWKAKLDILKETERRERFRFESDKEFQMERLKIEKEKLNIFRKFANAVDKLSRSPFFDNY